MLTREQVLEQIKGGRKSEAFDGRDYSRLASFFEVEHLEFFGFSLKDDADASEWEVTEWTEENILKRLRADVAFGFEKALGKRGLSACMMHGVVRMWMWILEDDLQSEEKSEGLYAQYGLPYLKAVALKYDLPNEIGDDAGDEHKYSEDGDYYG